MITEDLMAKHCLRCFKCSKDFSATEDLFYRVSLGSVSEKFAIDEYFGPKNQSIVEVLFCIECWEDKVAGKSFAFDMTGVYKE